MSYFYEIALSLIPGIGPIKAKNLIRYCGSAEAVFTEKKSRLLKIPEVGDAVINAITKHNVFERAEKELKFIEKEGVDKSNARMQREIKSLENRLRVKNQKLNDALSRSIDQYGSKTALLHDFNAVRLSRAGSRPKQHNSGAANSGPPRGRMQGSNNVSSRRTRSLERNSNISVQWQGQDAEKLELISNLEEKDAIIGQLRQQLTTISSLKQGNVYAPSDESQGDMLPLRL